MGLDPVQFREFVVRPTLQDMDKWSVDAENLLMGTALQESGLRWLRQMDKGPALGIYQCEPATHDDIWVSYLRHRPELYDMVVEVGGIKKSKAMLHNLLITNLAYATAICRVHYMRVPDPIPSDLRGQAEYWKEHYNTPAGAGTPEEFIENFVPYEGEL